MSRNIAAEVAALQRKSIADLRATYARLFGETTRAGHRAWLIKRIAWRMQALAEGDLSERARQRVTELARDADLRLGPPRERRPVPVAVMTAATPKRLAVGSVLTRRYKGQMVQVHVCEDGFEYAGTRYASLSAVAKAITGTHTSGNLFFGLQAKGAQP